MNKVETISRLAAFPALIGRVVATMPETLWRTRPADGTFAMVEHIWHLGDLEREGFGDRIERLLGEREPFLPDFRGDVIARERNYIELPVATAVIAFETARACNLALLAPLTDVEWKRGGTQEHVGDVTVRSVLGSMLHHDIAHANEIAGLLMELSVPLPDELTSLAALEAGASSVPAA